MAKNPKIKPEKFCINYFPDEINININDKIAIKERPFYKDHSFWTGAISSLIITIGILVSLWGVLISFGYFSDFELQVQTDGIYLLPIISKEGNFNFAVPMVFSNYGNRAGSIDELYLVVNNQSNVTILEPLWELDRYLLHQIKCQSGDTVQTPYFPIELSGQETKEKTILFLGNQNKIKKGKYTIELVMRSRYDKNLTSKRTFHVTIDEEMETLMNKSWGFYIREKGSGIYLKPDPELCK